MTKFLGLITGVLGVIAIAVNIMLKMGKSASIFVFGGADGPTSVFVAAKVGSGFSNVGIIVGIALILLAIFLLVRKKK